MSDKMRILLITGSESYQEIQMVADKINELNKLNIECVVEQVPVKVSAFITQNNIKEIWLKLKNHDFNMILIPGFIPWDAKIISDTLKIKIYKGTRFSGDLFELIINIHDIKLSHKKASDSLLKNRSKLKLTEYVKNKTKSYDNKEYGEIFENFHIYPKSNGKNKYIGSEFPPLLFAEIVNAPKMNVEDIIEKIKKYIDSGADVIDIATIYGEDNSDFLKKIIPILKKEFDVYISVDSINIREIITGIESGADFILSIDGGNIDAFLQYAKQSDISKTIGLVIIPLEGSDHKPVEGADNKIDFIMELAIPLMKNGFENLFYDPLLKTPLSPGIINSIYDYILLKERMEQIPGMNFPLFMGFNNVFELMDTDTTGVISLLSMIASELNVGGILSTEYSGKSLGAIEETRQGIDLAYMGKISKSPPINLGMDALFVKTKNKSLKPTDEAEIIIDLNNQNTKKGISDILQDKINQKISFIHDKAGYFKTYVNYFERKIELFYFPVEEIEKKLGIKGPILIKGDNAELIYKTLYKLEIVTELTHAFYLGKELSKAETSLRLNTSYFEDI